MSDGRVDKAQFIVGSHQEMERNELRDIHTADADATKLDSFGANVALYRPHVVNLEVTLSYFTQLMKPESDKMQPVLRFR